MKTLLCRVAVLAMMLCVAGEIPAASQQTNTRAVLTLPVSGSFRGGGEFEGTISINRFEQRGNQIVAVGFVRGVLSRWFRTLGTAVAGEVAWPVTVRAGGQLVVSGAAAEMTRPVLAAWSPTPRPEPAARLAQAESCTVLNVGLGPINVDLLGVQVALAPVALDLSGASGTPLGDLTCAILDLLGNVAGVVNLLNGLLGLITGLLGGLVGGIGGGVPVP